MPALNAFEGDPVFEDVRWKQRAACITTDPELFFPKGSTGRTAVERAAAAKAICATCEVIEECLAFALATKQAYGIWGGTDEIERRSIRAARRRRSGFTALPGSEA